MTPTDNKTIPDFFDEKRLDPVSLATGRPQTKKTVPKKKAGESETKESEAKVLYGLFLFEKLMAH